MTRCALLALAAALAACQAEPRLDGACQAGQTRCNLNRYERCAVDGRTWTVSDDCGARELACVPGSGCQVCAPGELACGGDGFDIVRCNAAGDRLDVIARCDPEAGELCAGGGACEDACAVAAASRSYEGCEYWAVDLDNAVTNNQGAAAAQQFSIVVANPLELPASVKVEVNDAPVGAPPLLREVASTYLSRIPGGGDLEIIDLDPREVDCSTDPRLNDGTHSCVSSRAFRITSTAPIVAYQFNPLENVSVFSNDASLLLPTSALGADYMVLGWPQTLATTEDGATNGGIDLRAFLTIVGTTAQTTVRITLSTDIIGGGGVPAAKKGDTIELALAPFDVVNLETDGFNADFSGTFVDATAPVAVFSGGEASDVPFFDTFAVRDCCADHLEEQLFPMTSLGTTFVATKSPVRTAMLAAGGWLTVPLDAEPEWWRVLGTAELTSVTTNLPPPWNAFSLTAGEVVTIEADRDFVVEADKPVVFGQFNGSQQTAGIASGLPGGDPSFALVPPVQQWRSKYVFLVPNKYLFDVLLISMPADARLTYDGLPLETALPGCEYVSAGTLPAPKGGGPVEMVAVRCPLSNPVMSDAANPAYQDDGRHTLASENGATFGLVVYGFDRFVSYAYPGGSNVDVINPE